jgi:hypothetical protein
MKKFLASIPNRWKVVYLVWFLINLILLFISEKPFSQDGNPYPFNGYWRTYYDYNYTEFIFYLIVPIVIYFVIKLWKKKDE